jgi:plasmid stability protein
MHGASMPNVLIRDLPNEIHRESARRAEREGRSLQQYLTGVLTRLAATPTLSDVLDHLDRQHGGRLGFAEAVDILTRVRAER